MASAKEVILSQLGMGQFLIDKFTADLSDAEYYSVPTAGTNHAAWILGHIAVSEDNGIALATGGKKRHAQATHDLFKGGSKCEPDAKKYPSRKDVDRLFQDTRAALIETVKLFDEKEWNDPTPPEANKNLFPTLGSVWALQGTHQFWHIGQLSVCRKALHKKQVLM